jgi:caffeoyl-CoA O-methyltransferase
MNGEKVVQRIRGSDKLLPSQEYFSSLYRGDLPYAEALYAVAAAYAADFTAGQFDLIKPQTVAFEEMSTPPTQLALFNAIIKLIGAKTVLEIGSFVGHSAMQLARMVGEDGHVTTIEVGKEFADIARRNFERNGFAQRVTLLEGSAGSILDTLPRQSFDMIFVDGSKQDYLDYTIKSESLISERGVIIVDDVFFHGDALNATPATEKGLGCRRLLDYYRDETSLVKLLLPMSNGILLLFRPRDWRA